MNISDLILNVKYDMDTILKKKSALFKKNINMYDVLKNSMFNRGFRAVLFYRLLNYLYMKKMKRTLAFAKVIKFMLVDIEISYRAIIDGGLYIPHAQCIVIGDAIVGKNVTIYQGVTIGATWGKELDGRRYPIIGNNVNIGAGAKVIGPISIGDNSIIGANSVVVSDISANSIASGVPAKNIKC